MALEICLFFTLGLLFLIPGCILLELTMAWQDWRPFERLLLAIGISIAFYPVLYYLLSTFSDRTGLNPYTIWSAFGGFALVITLYTIIRSLRSRLKNQANQSKHNLDRWEISALFILLLTLASRLWVAHQYPYPAWTDSLHHVMLTQLIVEQGRLPLTLEPYQPIPLTMYHLGLHVLAAVAAIVSQAPFHSALLWTAQFLNGLCGIGVYLVLARKVGRLAALTGLAVVGLFCYQPAFYVNWGRFTQLGAQSILLIAWLATHETISEATRTGRSTVGDRRLFVQSVLASLLTAGMLLIHFRVAAFYGLLLGASVGYLAWQLAWGNIVEKRFGSTGSQGVDNRRGGSQPPVSDSPFGAETNPGQPLEFLVNQRFAWAGLLTVVGIGVMTLAWMAPPFWDALHLYWQRRTTPVPAAQFTAQQVQEVMSTYYDTALRGVLMLAAQDWLLYLTGLAIVIGLWLRNRLVMLCVVWLLLLCGLGNTYRLGIPLLNLVNFTGTSIMFYLPFGLIIGATLQSSIERLPLRYRAVLINLTLAGLLLAAIPAGVRRAQDIETYRHLMTAADQRAMEWIRDNTLPNARFAINTLFWTPIAPHGTDGGYWIPYFAERQTNTGSMMLNLASLDYQQGIRQASHLVEALVQELTQANKPHDYPALDKLYQLGIEYIYIGAKGDYTGKGLDASRLKESRQVQLLYERDHVTIFQILAKPRE